MQAEVALVGGAGDRVDETRIVGASLNAVLAADANIGIDDDDAVFLPLPRRLGRADRDARRMVAMIAQPRQEGAANVGVLALLDVFDPRTRRPQGHVELGLASDRAGVAADAAAEVDQHPIVRRALGRGARGGGKGGGPDGPDGRGRRRLDERAAVHPGLAGLLIHGTIPHLVSPFAACLGLCIEEPPGTVFDPDQSPQCRK